MKEKIMNEENKLGKEIFDICRKCSLSFIEDLNKPKIKGFSDITPNDVDSKEVITSFMWLVFDLINRLGNPGRFKNIVNSMHGAFLTYHKIDKSMADNEMQLLSLRYEEYREPFNKYLLKECDMLHLASIIAKNICKKCKMSGACVHILLQFSLGTSIQAFIISFGKDIKNILQMSKMND